MNKGEVPRPVTVQRLDDEFLSEDVDLLELVPLKPLVPKLLFRNQTILFIGRQKTGKSRFLQQLSICLGNGLPFLNFPTRDPIRVLYVDLENRKREIVKRVNMMFENLREKRNITFYAPDSFKNEIDVMSSKGLKTLKLLIERNDPELVILDPFRLLFSLKGDENNAQHVLTALQNLNSLREFFPDITFIIAHHLRKAQVIGKSQGIQLKQNPQLWIEQASGHGALTAHTDMTLGLEREYSSSGESDLVYMGGVSRGSVIPLLILEDRSDMTFSPAPKERYLRGFFGGQTWPCFQRMQELKNFTFDQLVALDEFDQRAIRQTLAIGLRLRLLDSVYVLKKINYMISANGARSPESAEGQTDL